MVVPFRSIHVGVGGRGTWPLRLMRADGRWHPVALVDVDPVALAQGTATSGVTSTFSRLGPALTSHPEAEVVVVVTPASLHAPLIDEALRAGRHVLVEKPFTDSLDSAERLVAYAEQRDLKIVVTQNYRYYTREKVVQRLLAEERYGPPSFVTLVHHGYRPDPGTFPPEQPLLFEKSVHHFDSLLALLQRAPLAVAARGFTPPGSSYPGPAVVQALIEFEGPVYLTYLASFASHDNDWHTRIECRDAAIVWRPRQHIQVIGPGGGEIEVIEVDDDKELPKREILELFHRYLSAGAEPPISGRANLATLRLVQACIDAGERQGWVRLAGAGARIRPR